MLFSVSSYLWFLFRFFFTVFTFLHILVIIVRCLLPEGFTESYNSAFVVGEGKGNW